MVEVTKQDIRRLLDKSERQKIKVESVIVGLATLISHPAGEIVDYAEYESHREIITYSHQ